ncbi:MFS transporter [Bacillus halotolerans]|uniref:MFS transporter n=1 Tax=Bacillus halotolerans TaxID=260554 RepID=UPI0003A6C4FD|nr:MFS transporter [Bacillus halotolerans]MDG3074812.1 MFS transporter [Bacillus halotolerans]UYO33198.1 MFS transporter [Bacillus halotolerans]
MLSLLKKPSFLTFCLAQLVSRFGDGLTTVVILYLVGTASKDPLLIGLVLFCQYTPMILFSLIGGSIADRFRKHTVMICADLYRCFILILMVFSAHYPFLLIILVFLSGIGSALFYPARSSYVPIVVGEKHIYEAMAVSQSIYSIMQIAGPGIAGLLLVFLSPSSLLLIDAATYFISAFFIALTAFIIKKSGESEGTNSKGVNWLISIKGGIQIVIKTAPLAFLILLLAQVMFAAGIFNTTSNSLLLHIFRVPGFHFGMIEASAGIGAVLGAMMGPILLRYIKPGHLLLATTVVMGLWMLAVLPLEQLEQRGGLIPVYLWVFGIGLMNAFLNVPISSLFLGLSSAEYRGRAMSMLQMSSNFGLITGVLIAGLLSKYFGVVLITALSGGLLVLVSILTIKMRGYKALLSIDKRAKQPSKPVRSAAEADL